MPTLGDTRPSVPQLEEGATRISGGVSQFAHNN